MLKASEAKRIANEALEAITKNNDQKFTDYFISKIEPRIQEKAKQGEFATTVSVSVFDMSFEELNEFANFIKDKLGYGTMVFSMTSAPEYHRLNLFWG